MDISPLGNRAAFQAEAHLVAERLDLRSLNGWERLAPDPLTLALPQGGIAVLFRYGVVVFFAAQAEAKHALLASLQPVMQQPCARPESETLPIRIDAQQPEGMDGNTLLLASTELPRLQLLADVLAKSVVLALYESQIADSFDRIEPVATGLSSRRFPRRHISPLLQHIGGTLLTEQRMVGRVAMSDKPDLLWERADLERLYLRLRDEFEIRDRHLELERKLELISRTAQTVLDYIHNRRSLRVEWYIVLLIMVEIALTLYDMFVRSA